jgi:hypothetical protein
MKLAKLLIGSFILDKSMGTRNEFVPGYFEEMIEHDIGLSALRASANKSQ